MHTRHALEKGWPAERKEEGEVVGEEEGGTSLLHPATLLRALYGMKFLKVELALILPGTSSTTHSKSNTSYVFMGA